MNPHDFVNKWRGNTATERQSYQQFFLDLCALADHKPPKQYDPAGATFCFEKGVTKTAGGQGFADVWFKGRFAIEFKGPDGNLDRAYQQLLQYREALENPPLLIVSDTQVIRIHPNFTNTLNKPVTLTLEQIESPEGLQMVRNLFFNVEAFNPEKAAIRVTEQAAAQFAALSKLLRDKGHDAQAVAHYLIRLLFILFAEDIDLLPRDLFTRLVERGRRDPAIFNKQMRQLFHAMQDGDVFGESTIRWFNGGLFDSDAVLDLDAAALEIVQQVTTLDWAAIEPSILGTLFERSLDPGKRAQLGALYTSKEDILLIVEPVLMAPLRREWAAVQERVHRFVAERNMAPTRAAWAKHDIAATAEINRFVDKIRATKVLDPACGSGNFLYVSLRSLLDLERDVSFFAGQVGLQPFFPNVHPSQLYGIEKDPYANELARASVWIGYLQWTHDNGTGWDDDQRRRSILESMDNIRLADAILDYDEHKTPVEPEWPEVDVIVGNPPFLGGKKIRRQTGDRYADDLLSLYRGRLHGECDLVCYWFERARQQLVNRRAKRVGLLATNSIRGRFNKVVLQNVQKSGGIYWAQSDRAWTVDGAAVRVSMVAFDSGEETEKSLDGTPVGHINADLTAAKDFTSVPQLQENSRLAFQGINKVGPFDVDAETARSLLDSSENDFGFPNEDVVKPFMNGEDVTARPRGRWIVDFGHNRSLEESSRYKRPFAYVLANVKVVRDN